MCTKVNTNVIKLNNERNIKRLIYNKIYCTCQIQNLNMFMLTYRSLIYINNNMFLFIPFTVFRVIFLRNLLHNRLLCKTCMPPPTFITCKWFHMLTQNSFILYPIIDQPINKRLPFISCNHNTSVNDRASDHQTNRRTNASQ